MRYAQGNLSNIYRISCWPSVPSTFSPLIHTLFIASPKICIPSVISASVIVRGGTNRNVLAPQVMMSRPLSRAAVTISVGSTVSCRPRIRPLPRISLIYSGNCWRRASKCLRNASSLAGIDSRISGDERRDRMYEATRLPSGLPPNVVPWSPVLM